ISAVTVNGLGGGAVPPPPPQALTTSAKRPQSGMPALLMELQVVRTISSLQSLTTLHRWPNQIALCACGTVAASQGDITVTHRTDLTARPRYPEHGRPS